jgi:hypothetical protein
MSVRWRTYSDRIWPTGLPQGRQTVLNVPPTLGKCAVLSARNASAGLGLDAAETTGLFASALTF